MRESMPYGEAPSFEWILGVVGDFERRFNAAGPGSVHGTSEIMP